MVSTLACFNIGKAKDESGHEMEPNSEYYTVGIPYAPIPTQRSRPARTLPLLLGPLLVKPESLRWDLTSEKEQMGRTLESATISTSGGLDFY